MILSEVKGHLKRNGFTKMRTCAGWINLDDWQPYGEYGKNLMFRHIDFDLLRVFEQEPTVGYAGVWEFQ